MALLPQILSAIMGSGANKKFDPNDPTSMPFEEAQTGLGRFARRLGTGVDAAGINNEYAAKRGAEDRGYNFRSQLLDKEQGFRAGMFDKEQTANTARDTARSKDEWNQLHSRLTNQAAMQNSQNEFQSRLFNAREAGDQQQQSKAISQRNYELTGTHDPMLQQDILRQNTEIDRIAPRALGGSLVWDPVTKTYYSRTKGTDSYWDSKAGQNVPGQPERWVPWSSGSLGEEATTPNPAPAPAAGGGGGRSLGSTPEEIRAALGIRDTGAEKPTSTNAPPSSLMDRTRGWIDGQMPGGKTNMNILQSRLFKLLGITPENQGMLNQGLASNLLQ